MALTEYELGNYTKAKEQMELTLTERAKMLDDGNSLVESTRSQLMLIYAKLSEWDKAENIYNKHKEQSYDEELKVINNSHLSRMAQYIELKGNRGQALIYWMQQLGYLLTNQPHRARSIHIANYNKLRLLHETSGIEQLSSKDEKFFQTIKNYYPEDSLEVARANILEAKILGNLTASLVETTLNKLNPEIIDPFKDELLELQSQLN